MHSLPTRRGDPRIVPRPPCPRLSVGEGLVPSRQEWASIFMNGWANTCTAADSPYVFSCLLACCLHPYRPSATSPEGEARAAEGVGPYGGDGGIFRRNAAPSSAPLAAPARGDVTAACGGDGGVCSSPQRGRMSAQLTGEGETACSIRRQLPPFLPHPSAASPGSGGCHLPRARGRLWAAGGVGPYGLGGILRRRCLLRMTAWALAQFRIRSPNSSSGAPDPGGKDLHGEGESAIIQAAH